MSCFAWHVLWRMQRHRWTEQQQRQRPNRYSPNRRTNCTVRSGNNRAVECNVSFYDTFHMQIPVPLLWPVCDSIPVTFYVIYCMLRVWKAAPILQWIFHRTADSNQTSTDRSASISRLDRSCAVHHTRHTCIDCDNRPVYVPYNHCTDGSYHSLERSAERMDCIR